MISWSLSSVRELVLMVLHLTSPMGVMVDVVWEPDVRTERRCWISGSSWWWIGHGSTCRGWLGWIGEHGRHWRGSQLHTSVSGILSKGDDSSGMSGKSKSSWMGREMGFLKCLVAWRGFRCGDGFGYDMLELSWL